MIMSIKIMIYELARFKARPEYLLWSTMTSHDVEKTSLFLNGCHFDVNDFHIKKQKAVQTDKES